MIFKFNIRQIFPDHNLKFSGIGPDQVWEFAHHISERNACFLSKKGANERFSQKVGDSLIFGE